MVAGAAVFFVGALLFGGLLFSHGGVERSAQFRVLGRLLSGGHGPRARRLTLLSLAAVGLGAALLFASVGGSGGEAAPVETDANGRLDSP